ncbi:MAG: sulfotransferase [Nitrospira defluvii]|nr:sulfotransferase [Nitrospira defluvii]
MLVGIFGAGRNGSSLLMRLLDGSPGLWIYPIELNYLRAFAPRSLKGTAKRVVSSCASKLPGHVGHIFEDRQRQLFRDWASEQLQELKDIYLDKLVQPIAVTGDPLQAMMARVTGDVVRDLESYLDAIRSCYDERRLPAIPLLMFKSIEVSDLSRYTQLFPGMKFIHIMRHPYSNYSSLKRTDMVLKQKPFWFQGGDILRLQLESRWIPHAEFTLQGLATDPARHYLVRYEDLCDSPSRTVTDICSWLGVAPPEEPTIQTVLGGRHTKSLPINSSLKGVDTPAQVVSDMAKEYGYDDILTERERKLILFRTYQLGRRIGYFSAQDEALVPARLPLLLQWLAPDQWEYMNASSRVRLVRALIQRRLYLCRVLLSPLA